jgi:hypothetical protein
MTVKAIRRRLAFARTRSRTKRAASRSIRKVAGELPFLSPLSWPRLRPFRRPDLQPDDQCPAPVLDRGRDPRLLDRPDAEAAYGDPLRFRRPAAADPELRNKAAFARRRDVETEPFHRAIARIL